MVILLLAMEGQYYAASADRSHTPTNTLRQSADQQVVVEEAAETPAPRFRMLPPQHYMRYDGHPHTTTAPRCCLADNIYDLLLPSVQQVGGRGAGAHAHRLAASRHSSDARHHQDGEGVSLGRAEQLDVGTGELFTLISLLESDSCFLSYCAAVAAAASSGDAGSSNVNGTALPSSSVEQWGRGVCVSVEWQHQ